MWECVDAKGDFEVGSQIVFSFSKDIAKRDVLTMVIDYLDLYVQPWFDATLMIMVTFDL